MYIAESQYNIGLTNEVECSGERMKVKTQFIKLFSQSKPFRFESGKTLESVTVAFQSFGKLSSSKDNVVLVMRILPV